MTVRTQTFAVAPFGIVLLAMFGLSLSQGDEYSYATELISVVVLTIPVIAAWKNLISLPWILTAGIGFALALHSFGLVTNYYNTTDIFGYMTHFVSGVVVAWVLATAMVVVMYYDTSIHIPIKWMVFFIFIGVIALEGFWKIFEFTADQTIGTMMQHGLDDTMYDNLTDTIAGLVSGIWVAAYVGRVSVEGFVSRLGLERIDAWLSVHLGGIPAKADEQA
ncbi:MAG TPA: hypothetical protein VMS79_05785 [Methanomassiliicoccales archaeon]|jgi:hypothetical protein|nr:hypothetical protein [Methanomassiliicoccales archaeon]